MGMRLFVVVSAFAAEEEQNLLSVSSHGFAPSSFSYVGIITSATLDPLRTDRIRVASQGRMSNLQNRHGLSNLQRIGNQFKLEPFPYLFQEVCSVCYWMRLYILQDLSIAPSQKQRHYGRRFVLRYQTVADVSFVRDKNSVCKQLKLSILSTSKESDESIFSIHGLKNIWQLGLEICERSEDSRMCDIHKGFGLFAKFFRTVTHIPRHRWSVVKAFNARISNNGKNAIRRAADFAGLGNDLTDERHNLAIGSNENALLLAIDDNDHNRRVHRWNSAEQCYETPKYMRRNDESWVGLGPHAEIISQHDIDVSYDGKKWFHLFGDHCLKGSEPFMDEITRQCRERNSAVSVFPQNSGLGNTNRRIVFLSVEGIGGLESSISVPFPILRCAFHIAERRASAASLARAVALSSISTVSPLSKYGPASSSIVKSLAAAEYLLPIGFNQPAAVTNPMITTPNSVSSSICSWSPGDRKMAIFCPTNGVSLSIIRSLSDTKRCVRSSTAINSVSRRLSRMVADTKAPNPNTASNVTPATTRKPPICFFESPISSCRSYSRISPTATTMVAVSAARLQMMNAVSLAKTDFSQSANGSHDTAVGVVAIAWLITTVVVLVLLIATVVRAFF